LIIEILNNILCDFSGTASGGISLGGSARRSSEEERHTRRYGIPLGIHKRRYGDATATTPRLPTWWSPSSCGSGSERQRDR